MVDIFNEHIPRLSHHITGFAFVDDTDLITLNIQDYDITEWEILDDMQDSINR